MHITDYEKTQTLVDNDLFLLDGPTGTRTIFARDLGKELLALTSTPDIVENLDLGELEKIHEKDPNMGYDLRFLAQTPDKKCRFIEAGSIYFSSTNKMSIMADHRNFMIRGNYLGSVFTEEQKEAIRSGSFRDLYLGDSWKIGDYWWQIVGFDYLWGKSQGPNDRDPLITGVRKHHLAIMPTACIGNLYHYMNENGGSNGLTGGYYNSHIKKEVIEKELRPIIEAAFGRNYILKYREYFCHGFSNEIGHNMTSWFKTDIDLPTQCMIFGNLITHAIEGENRYGTYISLGDSQLPLFREKRYTNVSRQTFWLRDQETELSQVAFIHSGERGLVHVNATCGVRPIFFLLGEDSPILLDN